MTETTNTPEEQNAPEQSAVGAGMEMGGDSGQNSPEQPGPFDGPDGPHGPGGREGHEGHGPDGRGPGGGPGGHAPQGHGGPEASADEEAQVAAAVSAKDTDIVIDRVMKSPRGGFDVFAKKAGEPVMVTVSDDFATVEVHVGPPQGAPDGGNGPTPSGVPNA